MKNLVKSNSIASICLFLLRLDARNSNVWRNCSSHGYDSLNPCSDSVRKQLVSRCFMTTLITYAQVFCSEWVFGILAGNLMVYCGCPSWTEVYQKHFSSQTVICLVWWKLQNWTNIRYKNTVNVVEAKHTLIFCVMHCSHYQKTWMLWKHFFLSLHVLLYKNYGLHFLCFKTGKLGENCSLLYIL